MVSLLCVLIMPKFWGIKATGPWPIFSLLPCGTFSGGRQVTQAKLPENQLIIGPLGKQTNYLAMRSVFIYECSLAQGLQLGLLWENKPRTCILTRHFPWETSCSCNRMIHTTFSLGVMHLINLLGVLICYCRPKSSCEYFQLVQSGSEEKV